MSLLLEALKRAALEKQSKQDAAAANLAADNPATPLSTDALGSKASPAPEISSGEDNWPIIDMSAAQEAETQPETTTETTIESATETTTETTTQESLNDTLDQEDNIEPIEEAIDQSPADDNKSNSTDENLNDWADLEEFDELDFEEEGEEVANFEFDEPKEVAPSKPLELEETEQALLEAKLQQDELLREQEEAEARDAEELENRQDVQRKLTARENRHALDQLIASGKAVARKSKRRAAFLYAMLVMTALGGILAYYFYLLANSGIAELRQVNVAAPTIDVAGIIESTELENIADITETGQDEDGNSYGDEFLDDISGKVGSTGRIDSTDTSQTAAPAAIQANSVQGNSANTSIAKTLPSNDSVAAAERADPPTSETGYLRPLITTDKKGAQKSQVTERVIIHHEKSSRDLNTLLKNAYIALQQRNLDLAEKLYQEALGLVPTQRDALLGAASTASAKGRFSDAASFYQRQLAADPSDSFARAGLLALMNDGNSRAAVQQEVAMLLKENPRSAHLHFLKGVGFAASRRWSPAQNSFYEAYSLDSSNPDYAFNLAVALDHLKQLPMAKIYYERALQLANSRPANFDKAAVSRRLEGLDKL